MKTSRFLAAYLLLYGLPLSAQTLQIKLVDGRTGRPMVGTRSYVNVWVGEHRKDSIAIPIDGSGVARLKLTEDAAETNIPAASDFKSLVINNPVMKYEEPFGINVPYARC